MTTLPKSAYLHTVDVVVLRFVSKKTDQGRHLKEDRIEVLLHRREKEPFANAWALPGLVINGDTQDASIEDAAKRLMDSPKVAMKALYMEQVGSEGNAVRDPRCWSSTTFYLAIVGSDVQPAEDQGFFALDDIVANRTPLPFDHNRLVALVADRLYSKSLYSSLPLVFLGESLTLTEAIDVTACILKRTVQKSSMRSRLVTMIEEGILQETDEKKAMAVGRPQSIIKNTRPEDVYFFDRSFEK